MPVVSKTTVRLYPRDIEIIDAWAAANPDPDTGETPSRPIAIRRLIRASQMNPRPVPTRPPGTAPATCSDLELAVSRILNRLQTEPPSVLNAASRRPSATAR